MQNWEEGLVSVVTPVHNAEKYIRQTIASVQAQTYPHWEMVVVDDGSTDESTDIVKNAALQDSRIRLIPQKNRGVAEARNRGMQEAKGRYLAFLDSDDLWKPQKLEKQLALLTKKNAGFCYGACDVIDENGEPTGQIRSVPEEITYKKLLWGNVIPCLTVLVDRNITGEFSMPRMGHEDYATWLTVIKELPAAYGINEPLGSYRVNRGSVSANKIRAMRWTWRIYRENQKLPVHKSIFYVLGHGVQAVWKRK
jgi:teichuronic acid biosynthesis glycosyltransferase TuaG